MNDHELETLLQNVDSDRVERKASFSENSDKIREAVMRVRQRPSRQRAERSTFHRRSWWFAVRQPRKFGPSLAKKRRFRNLHFDIWISRYLKTEVLEQNHRTILDQLASLRFVDGGGIPTVLGLWTRTSRCLSRRCDSSA